VGAVAQLSAAFPGATTDDISRTPFALIGTHEQMADQILAQAQGLGITSYVVREPAIPDLERVLALINP
jgi:alkanesulfonate monooxygenase SsuD/methylene tetrahydromethanopterin reductase-like flavin-dependent oxidoreductase (luciferase family)